MAPPRDASLVCGRVLSVAAALGPPVLCLFLRQWPAVRPFSLGVLDFVDFGVCPIKKGDPGAPASTASGKMLWKTIDVKAATRSDKVRNCERSCSCKFPASANFAANFSILKPENLQLCPKSAKFPGIPDTFPAYGANFALTLRHDESYKHFPSSLDTASSEIPGNPEPHRAVTS